MATTIQQFDSLRVDPVNQCVWQGTEQINLSPKAFAVLVHLAARPGRLVTKQELLDAVWPDTFVTEGVLKRAILEIRKALADTVEDPRFIQTLHRRGYRFLRQAETQPAAREANREQPGMVGREREMRKLDASLDHALNSWRQVVFVAGEAGLGKTALLDGWTESLRKRAEGVVVARGRCLQQIGAAEPYQPVFEALEQLSRKLGKRLAEVLRAQAPTWLVQMPALISLEDRAKLRDEAVGATRERMLREISGALEVLCAETAIVIAIEDLQWADASAIDLVSSLARKISSGRLMLVGTYRPGDAARKATSLLEMVGDLRLHRQCEVLPLSYLSERDVCEYLAARFPSMESVGALAGALHRRTNGNPLFLNCLVEGTDGDMDEVKTEVPERLQHLFERQVAQLTGPEQEMLQAAAVAGTSFPVAAIASALGWDVADAESLCEGLARQQVVLKHGRESASYCFVHGLCRDALDRKMSGGLRSRLADKLKRAGQPELSQELPPVTAYFRTAAVSAVAHYSN